MTKRKPEPVVDAQPLERLLTRQQGAEYLGVSLRKFDYLLQGGQVTAKKVGRLVRIPESHLKAFLDRCPDREF